MAKRARAVAVAALRRRRVRLPGTGSGSHEPPLRCRAGPRAHDSGEDPRLPLAGRCADLAKPAQRCHRGRSRCLGAAWRVVPQGAQAAAHHVRPDADQDRAVPQEHPRARRSAADDRSAQARSDVASRAHGAAGVHVGLDALPVARVCDGRPVGEVRQLAAVSLWLCLVRDHFVGRVGRHRVRRHVWRSRARRTEQARRRAFPGQGLLRPVRVHSALDAALEHLHRAVAQRVSLGHEGGQPGGRDMVGVLPAAVVDVRRCDTAGRHRKRGGNLQRDLRPAQTARGVPALRLDAPGDAQSDGPHRRPRGIQRRDVSRRRDRTVDREGGRCHVALFLSLQQTAVVLLVRSTGRAGAWAKVQSSARIGHRVARHAAMALLGCAVSHPSRQASRGTRAQQEAQEVGEVRTGRTTSTNTTWCPPSSPDATARPWRAISTIARSTARWRTATATRPPWRRSWRRRFIVPRDAASWPIGTWRARTPRT